jgi:hypothetical protein
MGDHQQQDNKSRRQFLSKLFAGNKKADNPDMVKMLTADGKLVEVKRSIIEAASTKRKVTNKEILDWMDNPSKENK